LKNNEQSVCSSYGLHHENVSAYSERKNLKINTLYILKCFDSPYYYSRSYINNMTCIEAGRSGNKAREIALSGCQNVQYVDFSKEDTHFVKNDAKNKNPHINIIHDSM